VKRGRLLLFTLIIVIFFNIPVIYANDIDQFIIKGMELVYKEKFDEALKEFEKIKDLKYGDLSYPFFKAITFGKMVEDEWNESYSQKFHLYLDEVIEKAENKIGEGQKEAWVYFYLGASYGLRALSQVESGAYWSSYFTSKKMRKILNKALKLNHTIYDIYYAFGLQDYYLAYFTRFVPFLGGNIEKAFNELEIAVKLGTYSKIEAKIALAKAYFLNNQPENAICLLQEVKNIYPKIEKVYFGLGQIYYKQGKFDEAASIFNDLLSMTKEGNIYTEETKILLEKIKKKTKELKGTNDSRYRYRYSRN